MINKIALIVGLTIIFVGCKNENCREIVKEYYIEENSNLQDSTLYQVQDFFRTFEEPELKELEYEVYRITKINVLSNYRSIITFENNRDYRIHYKGIKQINRDSFEIKSKESLEISKTDWEHLQYLIYKFNFWTCKEFKLKEVADGGGVLLEGHRPNVKRCGKIENKIVMRANIIDEISWLYDELELMYEYKKLFQDNLEKE